MTFMIFLFGIFWEQITTWNQINKLPTKVRKDSQPTKTDFPELLDRKE